MFAKIRSLFSNTRAADEAPQPSPHTDDDYEIALKAAFDAYQRKDFAQAQADLERLIERLPQDLGALQLLAAVFLADGRPGDAFRVLKQAAVIAPDSFEIQVASAQAAAKADDRWAALDAYRMAIRLRPDFVQLYAVAGDVCEQLGRVDDAIRYYRQGIAVESRFGAGWLNLGRLLYERGRMDEARACFERVLEFDPDSAKGHFNRGLVLDKSQQLADAEAEYRRALELDSSLQQARLNLGVVLYQLGRHDEASEQFERCDAPNAARAHCILASVAVCKGDMGEGERQYALASRIGAADADASNDIAAVLMGHGQIAQAEQLLERAAADPGFALAQFNLALARLGRGRLAEGWALFDRRFDLGVRAVTTRPHRQPRWRGESLAGRHLLVWGEQGIGDELHFASLFDDLPRQDGAILIECHAKLAPLFVRSFPWARVVSRATPPAPELQAGIDVQIPAGSLGRLYRPTLESFPVRKPYLLADARRSAMWRERVDALGPGLKIGFCWRSSNLAGERALSCTRLEEWRPLFSVPGTQWICLQYDDCADELAAVSRELGVTLHRFGEVDYFDDLDEVAAVMSALDLVISAPTTVSIQSAALDIETWQMSYGGDWQTHGTERNPWLPAIVRFQRRWDQTWAEVMAELAGRLARRAAEHEAA